MRLIFLFITVFLLFSVSVFAQEIKIRKQDYYTELFIKMNINDVDKVEQGDNDIIITFVKAIKSPFNQALDDKYIKSITGRGNKLTITFDKVADFAAFKDPEGARIIGSRPREVDNVLMSYGLGAPLLRKKSKYIDDPIIDAALKDADQLAHQGRHYEAIAVLDKITSTTQSPYYEQEALFRKGMIWMQVGAADTNAYTESAIAMDEFIKKFPESGKVYQARKVSAKAKELSGNVSEAAYAYSKIFENSLDGETRREALEKIGTLYQDIGQYDYAIDAYEKYLANFKTDSERILAMVGKLYLLQGYKDKAYNYFKDTTFEDTLNFLDNRQVLQLANIFLEKGDKDKAFKLFESLTKNRPANTEQSPDAPDTTPEPEPELVSEALYKMGLIYKDKGDKDNYLKMMKNLANAHPSSHYGYTALLEYAEQSGVTMTPEEWAQYFLPVFSDAEAQDLWWRADLIQIQSLLDNKQSLALIGKINKFISDYPNSKENGRLLKIKEDTLYDLAKESHAAKNYTLAKKYYDAFLENFPESSRAATVTQSLDDIAYEQILDKYTANKFEETVKDLDKVFISGAKLGERWFNLWEDATYQYLLSIVGVASPKMIRLRAQEYIAEAPKLKYAKEVRNILEEAFRYPYFQAFGNGENALVVELFNENIPWLEKWNDQELTNMARVAAATALARMDMTDNAKKIFKQTVPMMTIEYATLGYSLCENFLYDINRISPDDMKKILEQSEGCGLDYNLKLVNTYTKDPKLAAQAKYTLAKNVSNDRVRERLIDELYDKMEAGDGAKFIGYEDIYLDKGVSSYKKNDFKGAMLPLKKYTELITENTEKKAEALYYFAKSLIALNDSEQAMEYFRQITNMPDSVYKNMAKSELEDYTWRKNLNKK